MKHRMPMQALRNGPYFYLTIERLNAAGCEVDLRDHRVP
jgi:hypothetical protein